MSASPEKETLIYCWPYTAPAEDRPETEKPVEVQEVRFWERDLLTGKKAKFIAGDYAKTDDVGTVAVIFLVVWVILIGIASGVNLGGTAWVLVKGMPLLALPLLAMRRGLTHIRINETGVSLESAAGKSTLRKKELKWSDIHSITLEEPSNNRSRLQARLIIDAWPGSVHKISLKKIATAGEWRKLVNAINETAPKNVLRRIPKLDLTYLDGFGTAGISTETSYTKLWLEALAEPPKRERLLPLGIGTELQRGKFSITRQLGAGGQGSAYLARTNTDTLVALKEYILPVYVEASVRKKAIESFHHEASVLSALKHKNIVKLVDSFIEDQRAYLVLEYIDGTSLSELVKTSGPLEEKRCVELAVQMCDALAYLHSQAPPLVHQDFTPDNMLLSGPGALKIIDFTVSKRQSDHSGTSTVVGKHRYIPPEQFRGKATTQSDVYALGCTLHFLLTGVEPEPLQPSHPILLNSNVTPELSEIVAKATQIDSKLRFPTVGDVRQALERAFSAGQIDC